jgi:hypothetical protein
VSGAGEPNPWPHLLMGAIDEAALLVVRDPDDTETVARTPL